MQSFLPGDTHSNADGWSRRRFLLTTVVGAAGTPVALQAVLSDAAASQTRPLTILSAELAGRHPATADTSILTGDRLARLWTIRRHLQDEQPAQVVLHLDATDQLLWELALGDAGVAARPAGQAGAAQLLSYSGSAQAWTAGSLT